MRPRSANEWRSFWHDGGEQELAAVLQDAWSPDASRPQAERVALLLGSNAPVRALVAELGRMRADLGSAPDPDADRQAAEQVDEWFRTRSR
jgi:phosphomannomutase